MIICGMNQLANVDSHHIGTDLTFQIHSITLFRNPITMKWKMMKWIRDALNLRQCSNLQKLDLNSNPISSLTHYKSFIIYYLSQISMFDCNSITQHELLNEWT